jgi:NADPH:quinone reductase-like Zn-dependent oxidoreductase
MGELMTTSFMVQRNDLRTTHWEESPAPSLDDGQVRLRVDAFALTSNNITYAALGDVMNYWQFYPTGDPATGHIPVWGFASVVESRCPGIEVDERFYGYWPIADEVILQATAVHPGGFADGAQHRRGLHAVYNQYVRCSADPGYRSDREAQQALLRPLFATSFLIDDFLADNDFFGAQTVILSSASSKTAYGTAFRLAQRGGGVTVVGLTSPANAEFTRSLGCYDDVVLYDDVASVPQVASVYVDMSGDTAVRTAVHRRLGDLLAYSCAVGATHWDSLGGGGDLPGPPPQLFFAPEQARKRAAEWGADVLQERMASAWTAFMARIDDAEHPWMTVVKRQGRDAVEKTYLALLDGTVPASEGHILSV